MAVSTYYHAKRAEGGESVRGARSGVGSIANTVRGLCRKASVQCPLAEGLVGRPVGVPDLTCRNYLWQSPLRFARCLDIFNILLLMNQKG